MTCLDSSIKRLHLTGGCSQSSLKLDFDSRGLGAFIFDRLSDALFGVESWDTDACFCRLENLERRRREAELIVHDRSYSQFFSKLLNRAARDIDARSRDDAHLSSFQIFSFKQLSS